MKQALLAPLMLVAVATGVAAQATSAPPAFRLPDGARPTSYALTITVVPGAPTVPGEIASDVALDRPHQVLWLNADDVKVSRATSESATTVSVLSGQEQFVGLAFDPPLPAGAHRVTLTFEAKQSANSTRGVFTFTTYALSGSK